ncbi:MAG: rcsC [Burkholderiaceae bacterium]|nr:rcsC [Burkholderiaceae bacterium]
MNWHFLLSQEEHDLYEFYIESYVRNTNVFLLISFLGYLVCTLFFFSQLTFAQHVGFGVAMLVYVAAVFTHVHRIKQAGLVRKPAQSVLVVAVASALWGVWWNIYFYYLSRTADEATLTQFSLILAMISIINIALMGRFARIYSSLVIFTVTFFSVVIGFKEIDAFQRLAFQTYMLALSQLIFLRFLNQQLSELYKVKVNNSDLVDALKQKNLALEQFNVSQSRYLSAASHDLRQPLHALALLTSDAKRKNDNTEIAPTLEKIEQAIDSLSQSFNAMLNLSRLDAGVVKPEFQAVSLQRVFNRLQVEFEDVAHQKNLELVLVSTCVWVQSDEGMLHSILSNLVSNAVRYTEKGKVLVGVRRCENDTVRALVYDTGTGVPAEKARQIFQEYQRLEYAQQRVKGGVGLGLAISERMARLLGAELLVESTVGKGSCFGLKLPRAPTPIAKIQEIKERDRVSDRIAGKRVAILDDDETAIDHLSKLLSSWHLEVSVVLSSDMLQEMIEEDGAFDLVLSDYHLGLDNETGLDVLLKAKELQPEHLPKCVLITGDTSAELTQLAHEKNIEILYKPLRPVRLRVYLNSLLGSK